MKKLIFLILFAFSFNFVPLFVQALTLAEIQEQLIQIQKKIAVLQNQKIQDCPFGRDLVYGDGMANGLRREVTDLQKWLIVTYLNIPNPTGHFGPLTRSALARWQRDNNLAPTGRFALPERLLLCGQINNQIPTTTEPIFCTMDAFLCPDGTYVGRTGPQCQFVCP